MFSNKYFVLLFALVLTQCLVFAAKLPLNSDEEPSTNYEGRPFVLDAVLQSGPPQSTNEFVELAAKNLQDVVAAVDNVVQRHSENSENNEEEE